jgi:hypothetical protein
MPDVISLLESDHREVEDRFAKAESTGGAAKQQVVGGRVGDGKKARS